MHDQKKKNDFKNVVCYQLLLIVYRLRVENMERQIANLTGLVQKALTHAPATATPFRSGNYFYIMLTVKN